MAPVMTIPLPRFHGAWGLLGAALGPGFALAPATPTRLPLAGAILFAFLALGCLEPGSVTRQVRRTLPFWIAGYGLAGFALLALSLGHLALPDLVFPVAAGGVLALARLLPPFKLLGRPASREVLGMGLLGLSLPTLLLAGGVAERPAVALYLLYIGFFGVRLALVRTHIAGRAARAVSPALPLAATAFAFGLWGIAIVALGLDPRLVAALLPILAIGFLRLVRDHRAERALRTIGLEELASVIAFAVVVILLGGRTLAG